MADLKELLDELEKVRLAPILIPFLRVYDPVMGSLPKGSLQSALSRKGTQNNLVNSVERLSSAMPAMIRFAGHLSESRLTRGTISLWAGTMAPVMKVSAPVTSRVLMRMPVLRLLSLSAPVLPSIIRGMDACVRGELRLERGIKRVFS